MAPALPVAVVIGGYLLGSIPFSYLVVKLFAGADIRQHGSRNVGATNVARTFGKTPGILALLFDIAKGYLAVALARWLTARPDWPIAAASSGGPLQSKEFWVACAALLAVLGHMFPVWLRFHGGKGVATATGAFLALDPIVIAASAIVFLIVMISTRFVSLASITGAAAIPVFLRLLAGGVPFWRIVVSIPIAIAVILKHHSNIARLVNGTELRMGEEKERS